MIHPLYFLTYNIYRGQRDNMGATSVCLVSGQCHLIPSITDDPKSPVCNDSWAQSGVNTETNYAWPPNKTKQNTHKTKLMFTQYIIVLLT